MPAPVKPKPWVKMQQYEGKKNVQDDKQKQQKPK